MLVFTLVLSEVSMSYSVGQSRTLGASTFFDLNNLTLWDTQPISVQELVLGTSTPDLDVVGSVHVNETTGVIKVKHRPSSDWFRCSCVDIIQVGKARSLLT